MPKEYGGFFRKENDDDDFQNNNNKIVTVSDFFGQQAKPARIETLSINQLVPFRGKLPFRPYSEEAMKSLVENIRERGLLHPIVVRKFVDMDFNERFEILSGHNRTEAVKQAGMDSILCHIIDVDDNEAMLVAVDLNLEQRQNLLPSEKAFAYKCRLEVMKKQGKRTDLLENHSEILSGETSYRICTKLDSGEELAKTETNSRQKIYDLIRLTNLSKPLLDMVDNGTLPLYVGVDISFLSADEQETLYEVLSGMSEPKATLEMSKLLKELSKSRILTLQAIKDILANRYGKEKKAEKIIVYSVKATKDFGKYLKRATKKRPLTQNESEELLAVVKKAAEDYIKNLDE